jgi:hypothetical protein
VKRFYLERVFRNRKARLEFLGEVNQPFEIHPANSLFKQDWMMILFFKIGCINGNAVSDRP